VDPRIRHGPKFVVVRPTETADISRLDDLTRQIASRRTFKPEV